MTTEAEPKPISLPIRAGIGVLVIVVLFGLDWVLSEFIIDYIVRVLILCGINVILAVGLNLINGTTGQFSIGHAGFMGVGAYGTAFTVITLENAIGPESMSVPVQILVFNAGLIVGALMAGIAGVAVGTPSLRLKGDYLAIVTLGFGEIIRLVFTNAEFLGAATGYSGGRPEGLPIYTTFFWSWAWAILIVVLVGNLTFSGQGRALLALRDNELAAEAVGLHTTRLKVMAFTISAMTAGVAGGLFAHLQSTVRPDDFKFDRSIDLIVMIIVGGLGSVTGAIVGAIAITVTLEVTRDVQEYRLVVYALLLIILMIVRPQGLLGKYELDLTRFGVKKKPAVKAP